MKLSDIVVLVTGGASGLGGATADRVVEQGGRVVILDNNQDNGAAKAQELGDQAAFVHCDVTDSASVEAAIAGANEFGPVRAIVHAAGLGWAGRTINKDGSPHDESAFDFVLNVNVKGTFNVLRYGAAGMARLDPLDDDGQRGVIINTASVAAFDGQTGQLAYAATKGAVVSMTLPAARDLSVVGVRVLTIAPGTMDTPLLGLLPDPQRDALAANIPFPARLGYAAEYAQLCQSMIENSYLNGEVVRLDGSLRMPRK